MSGMFDDLIPASAEKPAASGGMFDDLIPQAAAAPASPSLWKRATVNASNDIHDYSTGAAVDRFQSGQIDQQRADQAFRAIVEARNAKSDVGLRNFAPTPQEARQFANNPSVLANPFVGVPLPELEAEFNKMTGSATASRAEYDKGRAADKAEYDSTPSFMDEPTILGKAMHGAAALAGSVAAGIPNAENLIGGFGPKIARVAGENILQHVARNVAPAIVENAVAGGIANPAVQAGKISRGEQEAFSPGELAANVAVGGGIGGALRGAGMAGRGILGALRREAPDVHVAPEPAPPPPLQLPAPGRAHLTDEEIAFQRAASERGQRPEGQPFRDEAGKESPAPAENPDKLYGQDSRAPQTRDDIQSQRQAEGAFTLAERQGKRAGGEVRDTQTAGRPEGANPQTVHLDEGHPVDIIDRRMVPDAKGNMVEVATVRRYDPRTGKPEDGHVEYDVPVRQLKTSQYAAEPRMAQDFEARADVGRINAGRDRGKRMDEAQGLDRQTYRQTPPDDNAAGTARASRPEQPDGPHPGSQWSTAEEAVRHFQERQARGEAEAASSGNKYDGAKATNSARPADRDGRFVVDEDGHVMSTGDAPIRFKDQMQAGKWIISVGQKKSPDQIFEIANHPAGKGFTVRERGRSEAPGAPGNGGPDVSGNAVRSLDGPASLRSENAPSGEAVHLPFADKVRAEADRLWADQSKTGRLRRGLRRNEDWVNERAREAVMRQEAAPHISRALDDGETNPRDISGISRFYRREGDQTPYEAFRDATDRWYENEERQAVKDTGGMENYVEGDERHDPLQRETRSQDPIADAAMDAYIDPTGRGRNSHVDEDIPFDTHTTADSGTARAGDRARGEGPAEPGSGGAADRAGPEGARGGVDPGEGRFNTDPGPDGGRQTVIPGAERAAPAEQAPAGLRGGSEPPPKGGLFDGDSRNQGDIFDTPKPGPKLTPEESVYAAVQNRSARELESWSLADDAKQFGLTEAEAKEALQRGPVSVEVRAKADRMLDARDSRVKSADQFRADAIKANGLTEKQYKAWEDKTLNRASDSVFRERHEDIIRRSMTLHSNPFADPKVWAAVAKTPGLFSETWKHGVADLFDIVRQAHGEKATDTTKTNALANMGRYVFRSLDKEWRVVAGRYKSQTMDDVRTMFNAVPDVGRHGAVETTYHEGMLEHSQGNLNKVADIFKPLISLTGKLTNFSLSRDRTKLEQVVRLVENPRNIRAGTPIHDAAAALRKLLDDNHKYLKAAGVEIGKIDGYFPHMLRADNVRSNPDAFVTMAAREMLKNAATTGVKDLAEAKIRAESWRDHVLLGDVGVKKGNTDFIKIGHMPNADFAKERVLIQKSPEFFKKFYHTDPVDSLTTFFQRTSARAEWAKRLGDNNEVWLSIKDKMIKEGNAAALPQLVDFVARATGTVSSGVPGWARTGANQVRTWGTLATMPLAWLSSISETAMPAMRAGRPLQAVSDVGRLAWSIAGGLKKEKTMGEDLGLLNKGYGDTLLAHRFGLEGSSKVRTWIHNAFFKASLLDGLTHNQIAVAINSAQTFIRRLALDISDKDADAKLSQKLLAELGVSDHKGFSEWVKGQSEGRPTTANTRDGSDHGQSYRTAVIRFSNQSIQRPNPMTSTGLSQHPLGGVVQQLQSFSYSFTNNVLARIKNLAVESIRPGSGINGVERLKAWGPILGMLPVMAIAGGVSEARDAIWNRNKKPMSAGERALRIVSRAGMTGTLDPYINIITSARYRTEAASMLAGPVIGKLMHDGVDVLRDQIPKSWGGTNTDNTNTAERKLAQSTYDMAVSPLLMLATLPLPAAARTPAIMGARLGDAREGFTSWVAGPKKEPAPKQPKPPSPPKMPKMAKH